MTRDEMDSILERLAVAQRERNVDRILAVYAEDVVHDAVGREPNPVQGKAAVAAFYRESFADLDTASLVPVRRLYGESFVLDEMIVDAYARGRPFDLEGYSRPVRFRMLRLFEFRDGLIARETAWFDILAVQRQLGPPRHD